jgi:hypothetical protein
VLFPQLYDSLDSFAHRITFIIQSYVYLRALRYGYRVLYMLVLFSEPEAVCKQWPLDRTNRSKATPQVLARGNTVQFAVAAAFRNK